MSVCHQWWTQLHCAVLSVCGMLQSGLAVPPLHICTASFLRSQREEWLHLLSEICARTVAVYTADGCCRGGLHTLAFISASKSSKRYSVLPSHLCSTVFVTVIFSLFLSFSFFVVFFYSVPLVPPRDCGPWCTGVCEWFALTGETFPVHASFSQCVTTQLLCHFAQALWVDDMQLLEPVCLHLSIVMHSADTRLPVTDVGGNNPKKLCSAEQRVEQTQMWHLQHQFLMQIQHWVREEPLLFLNFVSGDYFFLPCWCLTVVISTWENLD